MEDGNIQNTTIIVPVKVGEVQIMAEVDAVGGTEQASAGDFDLATVIRGVETVTNAFNDCFRRICPDEASLEFSIGLSAHAGALLACFLKSSGKANVKVKLGWHVSKSANSGETDTQEQNG